MVPQDIIVAPRNLCRYLFNGQKPFAGFFVLLLQFAGQFGLFTEIPRNFPEKNQGNRDGQKRRQNNEQRSPGCEFLHGYRAFLQNGLFFGLHGSNHHPDFVHMLFATQHHLRTYGPVFFSVVQVLVKNLYAHIHAGFQSVQVSYLRPCIGNIRRQTGNALGDVFLSPGVRLEKPQIAGN